MIAPQGTAPRVLPARSVLRAAVPILPFLILIGCAGAPPRDPDAVRARLPELAATATADSLDPKANADYGLALHLLGEDEAALVVLRRAVAADPRQFDAALAMGSILLDKGELDEAERAVQSAVATNPESAALLQSFRARIEHDRLRGRMHALARSEQSIPVDRIPERSIGVLDFTTEGAPENLQGLGKAMTAVLTTKLTSLPELQVVERQRLDVLLDEMRLTGTAGRREPDLADFDPVDTVRGQQQRLALLRDRGAPFYTGSIDGVPGPATRAAIRAFQQSRGLAADGVAGSRTQSALDAAVAQRASGSSEIPELVEFEVQPLPRAGRLLGARRILSGNIAVAAEERLRVQSQIIDTIDGAILTDAQVERPLSEFHRIPGELVVRTAEGIGIKLEEATRRELLEAPPVTSSLAAFLAYGRGLTYEDQGLWENAAAEYAYALRLSPEFDLARQRVEMVRFGTGAFEQSLRRNIAGPAAAQRSRNPIAGRALGAVGAETTENEMRDEAGDLDRAVQTDGAPLGTVRVSGQVPVR